MIEELLDAWPDDSAYSPSIPKPELPQSTSCVTKRHSKTRKHRKQKRLPSLKCTAQPTHIHRICSPKCFDFQQRKH